MPPTGLPQPLRNGFNPLHYMYMFHRTDRRERRAAAGHATLQTLRRTCRRRRTDEARTDRRCISICPRAPPRALLSCAARSEMRAPLRVPGVLSRFERPQNALIGPRRGIRNGACGRAAAEESLRNGARSPISSFLNARD